MAAIVNGLSLSKLRAFGATFFIFSDYARPAIRLSALMELPSHLRLHARRHGRRRGRPDPPAGRAARVAARHPRPGHAAARRRQRGRRGLPLRHAAAPPAGGAGAVAPAPADPRPEPGTRRPRGSRAAPTCSATPPAATPEVILIATGSEVSLAVEAHETLRRRAASARASSRCRRGTSSSTSRRSTATSVLPPAVTARVAVEQASTFGWERYVGALGAASSA